MATAIAIRFAAGQYHATSWDTHVNEASVEWPPSQWRLLRGLIAVWHRKFSQAIPEPVVKGLIESLASECPGYRLPATTTAHTRQYVPIRKGRGEGTTLVFDGFLCIDREAELVVVWPTVDLASNQRAALAQMISGLGYLGRAESWVEARLLEGWVGELNCVPFGSDLEGAGVEVRVWVAEPPEEYARWRENQVEALGLSTARLNVGQKRLRSTLPDQLFGALQLDTGDVRAQGWSRHPGMKESRYRLRTPENLPAGRTSHGLRGATSARLTLAGKPLPRIEDAIRIGEVVRAALIRRADAVTDVEGDVPGVISGHGMGADNRHGHAFYMPSDAGGDGHIDHVIIHAPAGLDADSLEAIARLDRIWLAEGNEWAVILDSYGSTEDVGDSPYLGESSTWISATPYLHPWYRKKKFEIEDQIRRECRDRGLPEPELDRMESVGVRGRDRSPVHFHRFRTRGQRSGTQPDTRGSFWRLRFPDPIRGPIALGTYCHFGLGAFRRER